MPIYEYKCSKCGHQEEVLQKFSESSLTKCELCKGKLKKLISHSSFHLKGTGWYVTDYANNRNDSERKTDPSDKNTTTNETKDSTDKPKKEASSTSSDEKKTKKVDKD